MIAGVQIIDITDPTDPIALSAVTNGGNYKLVMQPISPQLPSAHQRMPWWQHLVVTAFKS